MRGNILWDALQTPTRKYERKLKNLKLSSEEVLLECLTLMDDIKEKPREAPFNMQSLWDSVYCDLRDLDLGDADEQELELGTNVILYSVMLMLSMCNGTHYLKMTTMLIEQICQHSDTIFEQLKDDFMPNIWRLGEEKLQLYVREYMDSEELWLSDELCEMLEGVPKMSVVSNEERKASNTDEKSIETLSNRQLIILFEQLMNIPLTPDYTNQSALAKLLSRVSGRSKAGIRQKIIQGIDYDDEAVRSDLQVVISLIKPISPELAERMKNNIE